MDLNVFVCLLGFDKLWAVPWGSLHWPAVSSLMGPATTHQPAEDGFVVRAQGGGVYGQCSSQHHHSLGLWQVCVQQHMQAS